MKITFAPIPELRRFVRDESGALRLIVQSGSPGPNATFSITRVPSSGTDVLVAPFGGWFIAEDLSGFDVSEPADPLTGAGSNVYDPTQHDITYVWDFNDPDYVPVTTPNLPTAWRDTNKAYGKQVAHVWHSEGEYTVTCYAFDRSGNYGVATYTFGADGDEAAIESRDSYYSGTKTICLNPAGDSDFTGKPTGAQESNSWSDARSKLATLNSGGTPVGRVLYKRGATYTDHPSIICNGGLGGMHLGAYGSGDRPIIVPDPAIPTQPDSTLVRAFGTSTRFTMEDLDFRGFWDASTETGIAMSFSFWLQPRGPIRIHRCAFSGFGDVTLQSDIQECDRIISDSVVTNWSNYGVPCFGTRRLGVIGCDIAQHEDALCGINQGGSSQNPTAFGNRHGAMRGGGFHTFVSVSSFLNRGGWSLSGDTDYETVPPTTEQSIRLPSNIQGENLDINRHFNFWDRCSIEGGGSCISHASTTNTEGKNAVYDKVLFVGSSLSYEPLLDIINATGVTIRNCYFYRPDLPIQHPGMGGSGAKGTCAEIAWSTVTTDVGPTLIYNCTFLVEASTADLAGQSPPLIRFDTDAANEGSEELNNVLRAADYTSPIGADFEPLGTGDLTGFVLRHKGTRWNFPPIIASVTARRESAPGVISAGTVENGEWVNLPYPDWTGKCNGAGDALGTLNATKINANSTQKHQVSVTSFDTKLLTDTSLFPDSKGGVTFDFHSSGIRIQNNTGSSWSSGDIWLLLDMSDSLMDFVSGTGAAGAAVPLPAPGVGSDARVAPTGISAYDHFLGEIQNGQLDANGNTVTRTAVIGAFSA